MLATPAVAAGQRGNGPRPIQVARDARQVLELLDLVFGPGLDRPGRLLIGGGFHVGQEAPFIMRHSLSARRFTPGFVWEENGRIIGNVTLVDGRRPGRFLIANVAVHPSHRRRGIGRVLMAEALAYLLGIAGRQVLLQVEANNEAAIRLYQELGFTIVGRVTLWEVARRMLKPLAEASEKPEARPLERRLWQAAYELDVASAHPDLTWPAPPRPELYKPGWRQRFQVVLDGRRTETWTTTLENEGRRILTGLGSIESEWSRPHALRLRVEPAWRGQFERPLLAKLLRRLGYLRGDHVQASHPSADEVANSLFLEAGFQARRQLTVMKRELAYRPQGEKR